MKLCPTCSQTKSFEDFYQDKRYSDGYSWRCRSCTKAAAIKSHKDNPDRTKANSKRWRKKMKDLLPEYSRRNRFGLPFGTYAQMLANQNGGCAICGAAPPDGKPLEVDHCHETGKVRSLLCTLCNKGLGCFRDNPKLLDKAKDYLQTHGAITQPERIA